MIDPDMKYWIQFALVIPMGWLLTIVLALRKDFNAFRSTVYTKDETDKMIQLNQKPLEQKLDMIQGDLHWIRKKMEER